MILEKLDRVVANYEWLHLYPEALIKYFSCTHSDHCPLQLLLEHSAPLRSYIFRFETIQLSHPYFTSLIHNTWHDDNELVDSINKFTTSFQEWNHIPFGNIFVQKKQSTVCTHCWLTGIHTLSYQSLPTNSRTRAHL